MAIIDILLQSHYILTIQYIHIHSICTMYPTQYYTARTNIRVAICRVGRAGLKVRHGVVGVMLGFPPVYGETLEDVTYIACVGCSIWVYEWVRIWRYNKVYVLFSMCLCIVYDSIQSVVIYK